jgi:hypothetical protein
MSKSSFYSANSSTFQNSRENFHITYGSGTASGVMGIDFVRQGSFSSVEQKFAIVKKISSHLLADQISGGSSLLWLNDLLLSETNQHIKCNT